MNEMELGLAGNSLMDKGMSEDVKQGLVEASDALEKVGATGIDFGGSEEVHPLTAYDKLQVSKSVWANLMHDFGLGNDAFAGVTGRLDNLELGRHKRKLGKMIRANFNEYRVAGVLVGLYPITSQQKVGLTLMPLKPSFNGKFDAIPIALWQVADFVVSDPRLVGYLNKLSYQGLKLVQQYLADNTNLRLSSDYYLQDLRVVDKQGVKVRLTNLDVAVLEDEDATEDKEGTGVED